MNKSPMTAAFVFALATPALAAAQDPATKTG